MAVLFSTILNFQGTMKSPFDPGIMTLGVNSNDLSSDAGLLLIKNSLQRSAF